MRTYFSTTPLILMQASSAACENARKGWATRINSARSATRHKESDSSSNIDTILRFLNQTITFVIFNSLTILVSLKLTCSLQSIINIKINSSDANGRKCCTLILGTDKKSLVSVDFMKKGKLEYSKKSVTTSTCDKKKCSVVKKQL